MSLLMRKIKITIYLFFIVLLLNGCETTQLVKVKSDKNLLSLETKLTTNNGPVIGFIDQMGSKK